MKVYQSALSKHWRGGLGSGYEVGERKTGKGSLSEKWSRTDRGKSNWREGEHKGRLRHEKDCVHMSKCVG